MKYYDAIIIYRKSYREFTDFYFDSPKAISEKFKDKVIEVRCWEKDIPNKIKGYKQGFYIALKFKCEPRDFKRINRLFLDDENLLDYMIVNK